MGTYDGVGHMRLCSALRKANKISKANQAGSSSSSGHAGLISDNSEVVQLLVPASEQYPQVSPAPPPPPPFPPPPPPPPTPATRVVINYIMRIVDIQVQTCKQQRSFGMPSQREMAESRVLVGHSAAVLEWFTTSAWTVDCIHGLAQAVAL